MATILVAGALVGVAGCGGDDAPITSISTDASTTSTTGAASESEFIAAADSRCAEANAAIANLSTVTSAGQQLEITQGLIEGLQALGPPADPSGALDSYFSALEDQVEVLSEQEAAVTSGDTATAEALGADLDTAQSEALAAAGEYGFEECGQEGTTLPESGGSVTTPSAAPVPTAPVAPTTTAPVVPVEPAPVPEAPPETGGGTAIEPPPETGGTGSGSSGGGLAP